MEKEKVTRTVSVMVLVMSALTVTVIVTRLDNVLDRGWVYWVLHCKLYVKSKNG
jgi:hypothetical protein